MQITGLVLNNHKVSLKILPFEINIGEWSLLRDEEWNVAYCWNADDADLADLCWIDLARRFRGFTQKRSDPRITFISRIGFSVSWNVDDTDLTDLHCFFLLAAISYFIYDAILLSFAHLCRARMRLTAIFYPKHCHWNHYFLNIRLNSLLTKSISIVRKEFVFIIKPILNIEIECEINTKTISDKREHLDNRA